MNSLDLTRSQAEAIYKKVREVNGFLHNLVSRIEAQQFPEDDPLRLRAQAAQAAVDELQRDLHWLTCGGTGSGYQVAPEWRR